jgi:phage host-nuclease inhibitor protein Gam
MDNEALHEHSGGNHEEEEEAAVDSSKIKQIEQMKADIAESEKGFVAQYWIEASEVEVIENGQTEKAELAEDAE